MSRPRQATQRSTVEATKPRRKRKPRITHVPDKIEVVKATALNNNANSYRELTPRQRWQRIVKLYVAMLKRAEGQV